MDSFTSSPTTKKQLNLGGSRAKSAVGGPKNAKDAKKAKDAARKLEGESKRVKRAELNRKLLFTEVKRLLDKADETSSAPGG